MPDQMETPIASLRPPRCVMMISVLSFFMIIGIGSLLAYRDAGVMHDQINKEFNEQQLILARQVASQIGSNLNDIEFEIEGLKRLYAVGPGRGAWSEVMRSAVERTRSKGLMEIGLLEGEGEIVDVRDIGVMEAVTSSEIAKNCSGDGSGRMVLGTLLVTPMNPKGCRVTGMLCTKMGFEAPAAGVLFAKLDVSRLVEGVTRDVRSGKSGYAWVIDSTGMLLYHPDQELIGKDAFIGREGVEPYVCPLGIDRIIRDQMLRGDEGTGVYVSSWDRGIQADIKNLAAFAPAMSSSLAAARGWSVVVATPASEVAEIVHRTYIRHCAAEGVLVVCMCVCVLLAVTYHQRISHARKEQVEKAEVSLHERE